MSVHVVIDEGQLKAALADLRSYQGPEMAKRLRKATLAGATSLKAPIKGATPVNRGKQPSDKWLHDLAGSVAVRQIKEAGKWIGYRVGPGGKKGWFAAMVIGGTKPHVILGQRGKVLNLPWGPRALVHHPGAKANPYVAAVEQGQESRVFEALAKSIVTQRDRAGF